MGGCNTIRNFLPPDSSFCRRGFPMSRFRRQILVNAVQIVDVILLLLSFGASVWLVLFREGLPSFARFLALKIELRSCVAFLLLVWLWRVVFTALGLYSSKRWASRKAEAIDLA